MESPGLVTDGWKIHLNQSINNMFSDKSLETELLQSHLSCLVNKTWPASHINTECTTNPESWEEFSSSLGPILVAIKGFEGLRRLWVLCTLHQVVLAAQCSQRLWTVLRTSHSSSSRQHCKQSKIFLFQESEKPLYSSWTHRREHPETGKKNAGSISQGKSRSN